MLIDLISRSNYQSYNVIIAKTIGLKAAVYLNALVEINEKAIRKNKLVDGHFLISRDYIKDRTTLSISQQKNIEDTLEKIHIIHKKGEDYIQVNIDILTSLMAAENEGVLKDLSGLKENISPKAQKSMSILKAVKSNINKNYPNDMRIAYEEWLDVIMNKFGFVSKQMLLQAQSCVDKESNHDADKAIDIIHIASANGWKDMSYAVKRYKENNDGLVKVRQNKIEVSGEVF